MAIQPISTLSLIFDGDGSSVDWSDAFWETGREWTIVSNTGAGSLTGSFGLTPFLWFDSERVLPARHCLRPGETCFKV